MPLNGLYGSRDRHRPERQDPEKSPDKQGRDRKVPDLQVPDTQEQTGWIETVKIQTLYRDYIDPFKGIRGNAYICFICSKHKQLDASEFPGSQSYIGSSGGL